MKAIRERKGITLAQVASVTKVPADLFAAFERGDLRRWPKGLFRRSFFRGYATVLGVPVDENCEAFAQLFPDHDAVETPKPTAAAVEPEQNEAVRLSLDATWHGPRAAFLFRLLAALVDVGVVLTVGFVAAWIAGADRPATIAIVALTYYSVATALLSESPARWAAARRHSLLAAVTRLGTSSTSTTPTEEPERRGWITDAYRIGPAPRLRVRIKVPQ